ncbi:MAG: hypothetical protein AAB885_00030, partial [Patescibacteria group bacterium]
TIILFKDTGATVNKYDGGGEDVQTFEIQTKDKISALSCGGGSGCGAKVDIVYSRQSPTATITGASDSVEITITAHRDSTMEKCVTINKNGYISIKNLGC